MRVPHIAAKSELSQAIAPQTQVTPVSDESIDRFDSSTREAHAANLIKTHLKAYSLRKKIQQKTVMPSEIYQFLKANFGELNNEIGLPTSRYKLSQIIAREIQEFVNKPQDFFGFGHRVGARQKKYRFPTFDKDNKPIGKIALAPACSFWVNGSPGRKEFEIEIIGDYLACGRNKEVFESNILTISLKNSDHRKQTRKAALVRAKKGVTNKNLECGSRFIRKHFSPDEIACPDFRIAGLLTHTDRSAGGVFEARDDLYEGDLIDTFDDMEDDEVLQILSDVALVIEKFEAKNLVHSDVKPDNILVSRETLRGYLSDFEFATPIGRSSAGTLAYIDALALRGLSTPFQDIYGLAISTAVCIFGADLDLKDSDEFLEALQENFEDFLSEDKEDVTRLFTNIVQVIEENTKTVSFIKDNPNLRQDLLGGSKDDIRAAMNTLYAQFPGFGSFLKTLKETKVC